MEDNMQQVNQMIGNLRNMAIDMGSEIENQNRQLDTINQKVSLVFYRSANFLIQAMLLYPNSLAFPHPVNSLLMASLTEPKERIFLKEEPGNYSGYSITMVNFIVKAQRLLSKMR